MRGLPGWRMRQPAQAIMIAWVLRMDRGAAAPLRSLAMAEPSRLGHRTDALGMANFPALWESSGGCCSRARLVHCDREIGAGTQVRQ